MTRQEISDLFDKYEDGYQAWRGNGVMTKGAFIEAVTEALRIHDVVGRSEQFYCTCSRAKGLDHDEEGIPYCISCQKEVQ
jgi:hypothetical protein